MRDGRNSSWTELKEQTEEMEDQHTYEGERDSPICVISPASG